MSAIVQKKGCACLGIGIISGVFQKIGNTPLN